MTFAFDLKQVVSTPSTFAPQGPPVYLWFFSVFFLLLLQRKRLQESSSIQAEMDTLKPYLKLKKLDAELPRWAEDMATFTGMTLQGRAEEVRLLKETERAVIQARENDNAA